MPNLCPHPCHQDGILSYISPSELRLRLCNQAISALACVAGSLADILSLPRQEACALSRTRARRLLPNLGSSTYIIPAPSLVQASISILFRVPSCSARANSSSLSPGLLYLRARGALAKRAYA